MNKDILEATAASPLIISLLVLISINIGVEIFRFVGMVIMSNKEKNHKRKLLIEEKKIKILEQLFQSLDGLSLFDKSEEQLLLEKIKEINLFMAKNKIYISKTFQKCTTDILDYFKNVLTDFRLKSVEKETKLYERFCNEFNK